VYEKTMSLLVLLLLLCMTGCVTALSVLPPVVFTSHERDTNWIFTTLSSLLLSSSQQYTPEIHVMVGGDKSSYLDNIKHHRNLYVHPLDTTQVKSWTKKRGNWRGGWNYLRCLNQTGETGVLIVEDDVVFSNDFWDRFLQVQAQVKQHLQTQDYVLDLYSRFPGRPVSAAATHKLFREKVHSFCCTQCMYYSQGAARQVYRQLHRDLRISQRWGYDMSIKHLLHTGSVPMFSAYPALVQHIGVRSSIGSLRFHKVDHFDTGNGLSLHYSKAGSILYTRNDTLQLLLHRLLPS